MGRLYSTVVLFGASLVFAFSITAVAAESGDSEDGSATSARFSMAAGAALLAGSTTYQVGFPVVAPDGTRFDGYFPFSELKWPLDVPLALIHASADVGERWRLQVDLAKNLDTPRDEMSDSDWMTAADPSRLDVYAEFEISDFDAVIVDGRVDWFFVAGRPLSLFFGGGCRYQHFDYRAALLYQTSPSGLSGFDFVGDGSDGIAYEVSFLLPYIEAGGELQLWPSFLLSGRIAFAPAVSVDNTDHHLLREMGGKIATGDLDGTAVLVDLTGRYELSPSLYVEGTISYLRIEADGVQHQSYGVGLPIGSVHQEITSEQTSVALAVGYRF